jgi:hypothetical protein
MIFLAKLLLRYLVFLLQRALENGLGMIKTQVRMHNISENFRSEWDALKDTIPLE